MIKRPWEGSSLDDKKAIGRNFLDDKKAIGRKFFG